MTTNLGNRRRGPSRAVQIAVLGLIWAVGVLALVVEHAAPGPARSRVSARAAGR